MLGCHHPLRVKLHRQRRRIYRANPSIFASFPLFVMARWILVAKQRRCVPALAHSGISKSYGHSFARRLSHSRASTDLPFQRRARCTRRRCTIQRHFGHYRLRAQDASGAGSALALVQHERCSHDPHSKPDQSSPAAAPCLPPKRRRTTDATGAANARASAQEPPARARINKNFLGELFWTRARPTQRAYT